MEKINLKELILKYIVRLDILLKIVIKNNFKINLK